MGGKAVDWDHWRKVYVRSPEQLTYQDLSEMPGAPAHGSIMNKGKPSAEDWPGQRSIYRRELAARNVGDDPTVAEVARAAAIDAVDEQINLLVDTAQIITEQLKVARALNSAASTGLKNLTKKGKEKAMSYRDIASFYQIAHRMRQDLVAMERSRIVVDIDVNNMSIEELRKVAGS